MRIDKQAAEQLSYVEMRKTGVTKMAPITITESTVVETKEGEYELPIGWEGAIALDSDGDPYPIEGGVIAASYVPATPEKQENGLQARSFDRTQMLVAVVGSTLNNARLVSNPQGGKMLTMRFTDFLATALAINDVAKMRWCLEKVEEISEAADEMWHAACAICGIDPETIQHEVEVSEEEPQMPPQSDHISEAPRVRQMPNTEHTVKPNELLVSVGIPDLSHDYHYAVATDDPELARRVAIQTAHEEDPSGADRLDEQMIEAQLRWATVGGEQRMP